ncbi:MAG: TonB-dependent receptor [Candidatus Cloacimonetes bacterium]|nr:TonB-dependent receptor [Candidatus Cloacimonadota bacterium]
MRLIKCKFLCLILFLIIPSIVFCRVSSKIGGRIISLKDYSSIPYVCIEIIKTGEIILTDEEGCFNIDPHPYKESLELSLSSIGYRNKHYIFEPKIRYAIIGLEPEPIIIPGMTVKSKKDNVLTLSQSNISVILPKGTTVLETEELIAQHPDIILEENAMGEKSIRIMGYKSRHVALLVDGVTVNNPTMNTLGTIPLEQIDHIEVLSGNASSVSGNAAMGGAINFVTKNPNKEFSYDTTIFAGSWDNYSTNLNISVPNQRILNSINFYAHKGSNNFLYYNEQEQKDIRRINNDITESSLSTKNVILFSHNISSTLAFQWYMAERGIPAQSTDYMWYKHARAQASRINLKESIQIESDETKHDFVLSYQHANSQYLNDIDNVFFAYNSENSSSIFDAAWQLDHLLGSCSSRLKTGYRHETYSYHDNLDPSQTISLKTRNNIFASYESSIPILLSRSSISVIPSLRFDTLINENSFLSSNVTIEIPRNPEEFQLTLSGGNSYTMPEFTSLFWKGDSRVQGNPDLKPERSFGGKTIIRWKSKKFTFEMTGSYNRIDDLIYWFRSAMGVWKPENLADADLYGFSGSVGWKPFEFLSLSMSGSKIFPINKTTNSDHYNKDIPHNPLHKLNSEIEVSLLPIELSLSITNLGRQYDNFSNTVTVDGYTVCNAGISCQAALSKKFTLQTHFSIRNCFDESYESSRNIPAPGRSFGCSCKLIYK